VRILGLDPGLRRTGWGVIDARDNRLRHVANGVIAPPAGAEMSARLAHLFDGVAAVLADHAPEAAAVEAIFVSKNGASTLKLGQARGVVMLAPARATLPVHEYAANAIKKSVVGAGHADKAQIGAMVRMLMPGCEPAGDDAADALAVAICHAHHAATNALWTAQQDVGSAEALP
jgi:crossover junction endodeoxyribonuclease RuvC